AARNSGVSAKTQILAIRRSIIEVTPVTTGRRFLGSVGSAIATVALAPLASSAEETACSASGRPPSRETAGEVTSVEAWISGSDSAVRRRGRDNRQQSGPGESHHTGAQCR